MDPKPDTPQPTTPRQNVPQPTQPINQDDIPQRETLDALAESEINSITASGDAAPRVDVSTLYPTPGKVSSQSVNESVVKGKLAESSESLGHDATAGLFRIIVGIGIILTPVLTILLAYLMFLLYSENAGTYAALFKQIDIAGWLKLIWGLYFGGTSSYVAMYGGFAATGGITMSLIYISLGVGVLLKKETARVALIVFMIISATASVYGMASTAIALQESKKAAAEYTAKLEAARATSTQLQSNASGAQASSTASNGSLFTDDTSTAQSVARQQAMGEATAKAAQLSQSLASESASKTANDSDKKKNDPFISYTNAVGIVSILFNFIVILIITRPTIRQQFK